MTVDPVVNFGKVTVSTVYDSVATSIVLSSGHGAELPSPSFNLTWWNSTDYPDPSDDPNVEIVRVTGKSVDTLTITRAQEGTSASNKNTALKTYKMVLAPTKKTVDDLDVVSGTLTTGSVLFSNISGKITQDSLNLFWDIANTNLGIGTTVPFSGLSSRHGLDIVGSGTYQSLMLNNAGTGGNAWELISANNTDANIGGKLAFVANNAIMGVLTSAGAFGIGTSFPSNPLHVVYNTSDSDQIVGRFMVKSVTGGGERGIGIRGGGYAGTTVGLQVLGTSNRFGILNDAGTENFVILNNGNVGIGTTAPSAPLTVAGLVSSATAPILYLQQSSSNYGYQFAIDNISTGSLYLRRNSLGTLTTLMTVDPAGNVGIGTTTPFGLLHIGEKFDVSASAGTKLYIGENFGTNDTSIRDVIVLDRYSSSGLLAGGGSGILFRNRNYDDSISPYIIDSGRIAVINTNNVVGDTRPAIIFQTGNNGSISERMRINYSGNVGIGTTNPGSLLEVSGGQAHFKGSADGSPSIHVGNTGVADAIINSGDNFFLNIDSNNDQTGTAFIVGNNRTGKTGGTELFRIQENGNVGIGTTSPGSLLDVEGDVRSNRYLVDYQPLRGRTVFADYQSGGIILTGTSSQWAISDGEIRGAVDTSGTVFMYIGNGFILPKNYSGYISYSVQVQSGAFAVYLESSTDGTTWTIIETHQYGLNDGYIIHSFSSLTAHTTLRFRFNNSNGTPTSGNRIYGGLTISGLDVGYSLVENVGERIFMNSNIGIGTTSPEANLHIYQPSVTDALLYIDTLGYNSRIRLGHVSVGEYSEIHYDRSGTTLLNIRNVYSTGGIAFSTGGTGEKIRINSAGNVGIGTISPWAKLDIKGSSSATLGNPQLLISGRSLNQYTTIGFGCKDCGGTYAPAEIGYYEYTNVGATKGSLIFATRDVTTDTIPTERVRITTSGNVGIGTTGPTAQLHIDSTGGSANTLSIQDSVTGLGGITVRNDARAMTLTGQPIGTDFTQATLVVNAVGVGAANRKLFGVGLAGSERFSVDVEGDTNIAGGLNVSGNTNISGSLRKYTTFSWYHNPSPTDSPDIKRSAYYSAYTSNNVAIGSQYVGWWYMLLRTAGDNPYIDYKVNIHSGASVYVYCRVSNYADSGTRTANIKYSIDNGVSFTTLITTTFGAGSADLSGTISPTDTNGIGQLIVRFEIVEYTNNDLIGWTYIQITANSNIEASLVPRTYNLIVGGNVGIGTTTPGSKLEVSGDKIIVRSTTGDAILKAFNAAGGDATLFLTGTAVTANWQFNTYSTAGAFYIQNNGNIGIGTTSPWDKFDVSGGITATSTLYVFPTSSRADGQHNARLFTDGTDSYLSDTFKGGGGTYGKLILRTSDVNRMTILANGAIGIGTTTPFGLLHIGEKFDVAASAGTKLYIGENFGTNDTSIRDVIVLDRYSSSGLLAGGGSGILFRNRNSDDSVSPYMIDSGRIAVINTNNVAGDTRPAITFQTGNNGSISERMRIDYSGNVGIGTTSPGYKLHVAGTDTVASFGNNFPAAAGSTNGIMFGDGAFIRGIRETAGGPIGVQFNQWNGTGWVDTVRITGLGNVGIGNTNPDHKLDVSGNVNFYTTNDAGSISLGSGEQAIISTANPYIFRIRNWGSGSVYNDVFYASGGNVGIGTTSPQSTLDISGSVSMAITTTTGNLTLSTSHYTVLGNAATASITITLPTAAGITGRIYNIKKIDSSTNLVTITTTGGQTIDGSTSRSTSVQYETFTIQSDGSNWYII